MSHRIPAVYMRGGTSKGVFFREEHLPHDSSKRDELLRRVIGSPDRYGKQTDGMGGATSSTSKVVIVQPSAREDCDVDYLFGQVAIGEPVIDWSGNCGNLSAAVGPFAISQGLLKVQDGSFATVRIWQVNTQSRIEAHIPVKAGEVIEQGSFVLDGVAVPGAEIKLDFFAPEKGTAASRGVLFMGNVRSTLVVPGVGELDATLIYAGNPTIFLHAPQLGLRGTELQGDVNHDAELLARCESIRAHAAVVMGIAPTCEHATRLQPHTPKLAFVAEPLPYIASDGKPVAPSEIDLNVRILSMGKLHHAVTGTGAIAVAVAGAIPGTVVSDLVQQHESVGPEHSAMTRIRFGHPSGITSIAAQVEQVDGVWHMVKTSVSRTARTLMEGWVVVPEDYGS